MEPTTNPAKGSKPAPPKIKSTVKKLDPNSVKLLTQLKEKANKKDFGRKVLEREIIAHALKLMTDEHLKELQAQTYSERDRLAMAHEDYQKSHGKISLDQFIGKLIRKEL